MVDAGSPASYEGIEPQRSEGETNKNMCRKSQDFLFIPSVPEETIRKEKEKARALRKTRWWQRRVAAGVCHYCHRTVDPEELTMDHVVPLIRGGRSTRGNTVPACKTCNSRKKYLLPVEWDDYLHHTVRESTSDRNTPDGEFEGH